MRKICLFAILVSVLLTVCCFASASSEFQIGGEIVFGAYEQDGNFQNGKEPISWLIVDVDQNANTMTLVSKYLLDCVQYNTNTRKTSWADSTLNQWLQQSFVPEAFSQVEQQFIVPVRVSGAEQSVYIPSEKEMKRYFTSFLCNPTCKCQAFFYTTW